MRKVVRSLEQRACANDSLSLWKLQEAKPSPVIWQRLILLLQRVWAYCSQPNVLRWQDRTQDLWDGLVSCKGQSVENELLCWKQEQKESRSLRGETRKNNSAFLMKREYLSYVPRSLFGSLLSSALTVSSVSTGKVPHLWNSAALITLSTWRGTQLGGEGLSFPDVPGSGHRWR